MISLGNSWLFFFETWWCWPAGTKIGLFVGRIAPGVDQCGSGTVQPVASGRTASCDHLRRVCQIPTTSSHKGVLHKGLKTTPDSDSWQFFMYLSDGPIWEWWWHRVQKVEIVSSFLFGGQNLAGPPCAMTPKGPPVPVDPASSQRTGPRRPTCHAAVVPPRAAPRRANRVWSQARRLQDLETSCNADVAWKAKRAKRFGRNRVVGMEHHSRMGVQPPESWNHFR